MGSFERRQQFRELMEKLKQPTIKLEQSESSGSQSPRPMEQFFITYMGLCFVQGYRVQERVGENLLLLSQMSFQGCWDYNMPGTKKMHGMYRILCIEFKEDINEDRELRLEIFSNIKRLINDLKENGEEIKVMLSCLEIHFIFVSNFKYSIVDLTDLEKGSALNVKSFYDRDYGLSGPKGYRILGEREEGTKLHSLVQLFLKGSGIFRSPKTVNSEIFHHTKFNYSPEKIINTICYIVGKEFLLNNYQTLTAEKWMRKSTVKRFKRFDLLLRSDEKVCIIDWKFSKIDAQYKMTANKIAERNKVYFQLARKEFNSTVQLKFYCFHQKLDGKNHHKYTVAEFTYNIESVDISDSQLQEEEDSQDFCMNEENIQKQRKQSKEEKYEKGKAEVKQIYQKKTKQKNKEKEDITDYKKAKLFDLEDSSFSSQLSKLYQDSSNKEKKEKTAFNPIQIEDSSDIQILSSNFQPKQKKVIDLD